MFSWCCPCTAAGRRVNALDRHINLLMLGLDNAGKTCTARSLAGDKNPGSSAAPTVGFSRVEAKYKGFRVTIFDLGGSRSFRGIWPKYYHEAHGFVFVVDAAGDQERVDECRETLREVLRHDKVRGKPLLLLCNKADAEDARDETQVVDELNVELLVNEARCPTRVERCVANRGQGLRVGYKWLVKSVIANMADLGPRVEADVELERQLEVRRKAEVMRRIEERRRREEEEEEEQVVVEAEEKGPGFVPMGELKKRWDKEEKQEVVLDREKLPSNALALTLPPLVMPVARAAAGSSTRVVEVAEQPSPFKVTAVVASPPKVTFVGSPHSHSTTPPPEKAQPGHAATNGNGATSARSSNGGTRLPEPAPPAPPPKPPLDLEPISQPRKKRGFLKRLNRTAPFNSSVDSKPGSSKSGSSMESLRVSQVIRAYTER